MRFSPGCNCCSCVADASHVCICTCLTPLPKTYYTEDGVGALTLNYTTATLGFPAWVATRTFSGISLYTGTLGGPCFSVGSGDWVVLYALYYTCPVGGSGGLWTFRESFPIAPCGDGTIQYGQAAGPININQNIIKSATAAWTCDPNGLSFALPTDYTSGSTTLSLMGAGGTMPISA